MVNTPRDLPAETRGVLASHHMVNSPRNRLPASIGEFAGPHRPFPLDGRRFRARHGTARAGARHRAARRGPRAEAAARAAALQSATHVRGSATPSWPGEVPTRLRVRFAWGLIQGVTWSSPHWTAD